MMDDTVLVRAMGGKPAKLIAVGVGRGLVYAASPSSMDRVKAGESWPVGFPAEDVFWFDEAAFEALRSRWESTETLSLEDWRRFRLRPYSGGQGEFAA